MDNQKVVYVVIKESDNILLIKNEHWHDYSFVGGKCEDQDEDIPEITAYRETQEELGLIGGAHFVLDQIGDHSFSVKKYSARTGTVRDYRFYLFLFSARRDSVRRKVERDNTVWVKISEIHEFEYDGFPVAETVQQVFKNIDLSHFDSFSVDEQNNEQRYADEVLKALSDEATPGMIDQYERHYLNQKIRELNIPESIAKGIEQSLTVRMHGDSCVIVNPEAVEHLAEQYPALLADLMMYGKIRKFASIRIMSIFSEGKTSAFVFHIVGGSGGAGSEHILKYDYRYRVLKEFNNFQNNERYHGIYSTKCNVYMGGDENGYAFLELQPAQEYAGATKMFSLRHLVRHQLQAFCDDPQLKGNLIDALNNLIEWLFRTIYKWGDNASYYQSHVFPFQNSVDHFLPPRRVLYGEIAPASEKMDPSRYTLVSRNNIIQYDILPVEKSKNTEIVFKAVFFEKKSGIYNRIDIRVMTDLKEFHFLERKSKNWSLWIDRHKKGKAVRKRFYDEIRDEVSSFNDKNRELKLAPLFEPIESDVRFCTGYYLESILRQQGVNYLTPSLHGDLNPSNILMCLLPTGKYHPILIDYYETDPQGLRFSGNLFYDMAKLEIEIMVQALSDNLKRVFFSSAELSSLNNKELLFILGFEESLFMFDFSTEFFKGDFLLYELRKTLKRIASTYLADQYDSYDWYRNYLTMTGVYALSFSKYTKEDQLARTISRVLALRYFFRVDNFEKYLHESVLPPRDEQLFDNEMLASPLKRFIKKCNVENNLTRNELAMVRLQPTTLFVDFYGKLKQQVNLFLQQNERNIFFIVAYSGLGKSTFIDSFTTDEFLYPVIFLSGAKQITDEMSFIDDIQKKLDLTADWLNTIEYYFEKTTYPFCIVIDNISLNPEPIKAVEALKKLITKTSGTRVHVIVTCIPGFWNEYLDSDPFMPEITYGMDTIEGGVRVFRTYFPIDPPNEKDSDELISRYFREYSISGSLLKQAKAITNNLNVLKLFCELNRGEDIGCIEHVYQQRVIETYVSKIINSLFMITGIPPEDSTMMLGLICHQMREDRKGYLSRGRLIEIIASRFDIFNERQACEQFVAALIQTNIMMKVKDRFVFAFPELLAYLNALNVVTNWESTGYDDSQIRAWFEKGIRIMHSDSFMVSLFYYVLSILYTRDDARASRFSNVLHLLVSLFHLSPYQVLIVFSKIIYTIPRVSSGVMKTIQSLERKVKQHLLMKKDKLVEKKYNQIFNRIDAFVEYGESAQYWTGILEKIDDYEIAVKEIERRPNHWNQLYGLLWDDYHKNGQFIKNHLVGILRYLAANPLGHEDLTLSVCEILFKFRQVEQVCGDAAHHALAGIVEYSASKYYGSALGLLLKKKTGSKHLLEFILQRMYSWVERDRANRQTVRYFRNMLLMYLLKFDNYLEIEVDRIAFDELKNLMGKIDIISLSPAAEKSFVDYLRKGEDCYVVSLMERLIKKNPNIDNTYMSMYEKAKAKVSVEEQYVIYCIIKHNDGLLLQYKQKWNDYNWIGGQISGRVTNPEAGRKAAIKIVESKLNITHPDDFDVIGNPMHFGDHESISRSRNRLVHYKPTFYIVTLKHQFVLKDRILSSDHNRMFSLDELQQPVNTEVAGAVKAVMGLFVDRRLLWNKIPDAL